MDTAIVPHSTHVKKRVSLNQTYRQKRTFEEYPEVRQAYEAIADVTKTTGFVRPHDGTPKGRLYDDAVLFVLAGGQEYFKDKRICELGGRDGLFGAYLTQWAKTVHVSDYFERWGKGTSHDLGQLDYWSDLWTRAAGEHSDKLYCGTANMLSLQYADNEFDCVISTSVIEHLFPQVYDENQTVGGDLRALDEMIRICRPGGLILLSTDMIGDGQPSTYHSGTHYYNKTDLLERIIGRPGVELYVPNDNNNNTNSNDNNTNNFGKEEAYNFDMSDVDNDAVGSHDHVFPTCPVVFALCVTKKMGIK